MITLKNLTKVNKRSKRKIVGRGYGSGKGGHTSGRGSKGQKSRSGYTAPSKVFEGGQTPLGRRLPKLRGISQSGRGSLRGYFRIKKDNVIINLNALDKKFEEGEINPDTVFNKGLVKKSKKANIKILGGGVLKKKFIIKGIRVSKSAKEKIEKAGGKVF